MTITERIDAITGLSPRYRAEVIPAPRSCKIEITAECNYNCSFCARSVREMSGSMDRAMFSRIIRDLRDSGVEELGLFYIGESFTCKWLPEAIAEAKAVGFPYVFLTTNGAAAPPERVKACMQAGLDSLKFSMNFYDREQMAKVTVANMSNDIAKAESQSLDAAFANGAMSRASWEDLAPSISKKMPVNIDARGAKITVNTKLETDDPARFADASI